MERFTKGIYLKNLFRADVWNMAFTRLEKIEDILGNEYDLERLRELVEADRDGRCMVLPVKPGGMVRFAANPRAKHEKVDCINIYADGRIMYGLHETGMKTRWVDEWSEDESEKYVAVDATLEGEKKDDPGRK